MSVETSRTNQPGDGDPDDEHTFGYRSADSAAADDDYLEDDDLDGGTVVSRDDEDDLDGDEPRSSTGPCTTPAPGPTTARLAPTRS